MNKIKDLIEINIIYININLMISKKIFLINI
jgi:hypothetical protein